MQVTIAVKGAGSRRRFIPRKGKDFAWNGDRFGIVTLVEFRRKKSAESWIANGCPPLSRGGRVFFAPSVTAAEAAVPDGIVDRDAMTHPVGI